MKDDPTKFNIVAKVIDGIPMMVVSPPIDVPEGAECAAKVTGYDDYVFRWRSAHSAFVGEPI